MGILAMDWKIYKNKKRVKSRLLQQKIWEASLILIQVKRWPDASCWMMAKVRDFKLLPIHFKTCALTITATHACSTLSFSFKTLVVLEQLNQASTKWSILSSAAKIIQLCKTFPLLPTTDLACDSYHYKVYIYSRCSGEQCAAGWEPVTTAAEGGFGLTTVGRRGSHHPVQAPGHSSPAAEEILTNQRAISSRKRRTSARFQKEKRVCALTGLPLPAGHDPSGKGGQGIRPTISLAGNCSENP